MMTKKQQHSTLCPQFGEHLFRTKVNGMNTHFSLCVDVDTVNTSSDSRRQYKEMNKYNDLINGLIAFDGQLYSQSHTQPFIRVCAVRFQCELYTSSSTHRKKILFETHQN